MTNRQPGVAPPGRRAVGRWTWLVTALLLVQVPWARKCAAASTTHSTRCRGPRRWARSARWTPTHREWARSSTGWRSWTVAWVWTRHAATPRSCAPPALALATVAAQVVAGMALAGLALPPPAQVRTSRSPA